MKSNLISLDIQFDLLLSYVNQYKIIPSHNTTVPYLLNNEIINIEIGILWQYIKHGYYKDYLSYLLKNELLEYDYNYYNKSKCFIC
jgi:hypothetical protein